MPLNQPKPSTRILGAMLHGIAGQTYPQQLYTLGLEDLNAKGIRGAKRSGWRFLGKLAGRDMSLDVAQARGKPAEMTELAARVNCIASSCRSKYRTTWFAAMKSPLLISSIIS